MLHITGLAIGSALWKLNREHDGGGERIFYIFIPSRPEFKSISARALETVFKSYGSKKRVDSINLVRRRRNFNMLNPTVGRNPFYTCVGVKKANLIKACR